MQNIIIDEEFRIYLPTLDKVTYEGLEKMLLEQGVRDPLVLWNEILIDGYNRFKICTEHNIPFTTVSMEFDSREDVLDWIVENHEYVKLLLKKLSCNFQMEQADIPRLRASFLRYPSFA